MMLRVIATLAAGVSAVVKSDGWGDGIEWYSTKEAIPLARQKKKPVMVLIHQTWCGVCKALKPKFASDKTIEALSKHFVMVNGGNDLEPKDAKYRPDGLKGSYYPRVIFLQPDGTRIDSVKGPNNDYVAFYPNPDAIQTAMKKALKAAGVDLEAAERERQALENELKEQQQAAHAETVPEKLREIFKRIDLDHDETLSVDEFGTFVDYIGGAKPNEEQYFSMCKSYGVPTGLTFDKMSSVYAARGPDEINNAYKKIVGETGRSEL